MPPYVMGDIDIPAFMLPKSGLREYGDALYRSGCGCGCVKYVGGVLMPVVYPDMGGVNVCASAVSGI